MMNVKAEPTSEVVEISAGRARLWRARTAGGQECFLVVRTVAIPLGSNMEEFDTALEMGADDAGVSVTQLGALADNLRLVDLDRVKKATVAMGTRSAPDGGPALNEIFMLQLRRSEMELLFGMISSVFAVELAGALTPDAVVVGAGGAQKFPDWLGALGARQISSVVRKFMKEEGIDAMRETVNRFLKLFGRELLK